MRTIEFQCIAPDQLNRTPSSDDKENFIKHPSHSFSDTDSLHIHHRTTCTYDHDNLNQQFSTTIHYALPWHGKSFNPWYPQESNLTMNVDHFNASIPSGVHIGDRMPIKKLSSPQHDSSMYLKMIVVGWAAVEADRMDPVCEVLREMDLTPFRLCETIERIAMLRILRAVLDKSAYLFSATRPAFPRYTAPTVLQESSSALPSALNSILIWLSLQNLPISRKITRLIDQFLLQYFRTL